MTVLIAPASFKGSLSATRAAGIIREAILASDPAVRCILLPQADGGEGTLDSVYASRGGTMMRAPVPDLAGKPATARWLLNDDGSALLEAAECIGWNLPAGVAREPERFFSTGLGHLLLHAAERSSAIAIGLGGSATSDCGLGMAEALGAVIESGEQGVATIPERLAAVRSIAWTGGLGVPITVLADVRNPLTGAHGAAFVYGPQKGIGADRLLAFDAAIGHFAGVVRRDVRDVDPDTAGMGAAGGLGFAVAAFGAAELRSGAAVVRERTGFDALLGDCDLVITGEGSIDAQTLQGKVVQGVAEAAALRAVPVLAFAGRLNGDTGELSSALRGATLRCITPEGIPMAQALSEAAAFLYAAVRDHWKRFPA